MSKNILKVMHNYNWKHCPNKNPEKPCQDFKKWAELLEKILSPKIHNYIINLFKLYLTVLNFISMFYFIYYKTENYKIV